MFVADRWLTCQDASGGRQADIVDARQAFKILNDRVAESPQQGEGCTLRLARLPSVMSGWASTRSWPYSMKVTDRGGSLNYLASAERARVVMPTAANPLYVSPFQMGTR